MKKMTMLAITLFGVIAILIILVCAAAQQKAKLERDNAILVQSRTMALIGVDGALEDCQKEKDRLRVENLRLKDENQLLETSLKAYRHATSRLQQYHMATMDKVMQNYAAHRPLTEGVPLAPSVADLMGSKLPEVVVKSD